MAEPMSGDSYVTDQSAMYFFGRSFEPKSESCSDPLFADPSSSIPYLDGGYIINWTNLTNGSSASGSANCMPGIISGKLTVRWNTFKVLPAYLLTYPIGIPLDMGANMVRVSASDASLDGATQITVTRVPDVTVPEVHSVEPVDGETFSFRIVVYFEEQIEPTSVTGALLILDENAQPVVGTTVYDSADLTVSWRPDFALEAGKTYTASVSGVMDLSGNILTTPYQWSFVTRP